MRFPAKAIFLAVVLLFAAGLLSAAQSPQTPLPGSAIRQFAQPLPLLSVKPQGGTITTVLGNTALTLRMCEFRANVLPPDTIKGYAGTWVWGYLFDPAGSTPCEKLVWQYADDAYAVVAPRSAGPGDYAMTKAEMRQVAAAFHLGNATPVVVPFRMTVVPPGYRLVLAQWEPTEGLPAMIRFLPVSVANPRISDVDHGPEPDPHSAYADQLRIEVVKPVPGEFAGDSSSGTQCPEANHGGRCYRWLPGDKYVVEALCRVVVKDQLAGLVDRIEVADPGNRATWLPANRAFPASAQVGG